MVDKKPGGIDPCKLVNVGFVMAREKDVITLYFNQTGLKKKFLSVSVAVTAWLKTRRDGKKQLTRL
jgi:hypothetical protein